MKLFAFLFLATSIIAVQDFSYGKPSEMKGMTKVFVNTGADMTNRERIIKELQNAKLDLELLDSEDGADIILVFAGGKEQITVGSVSNGMGSLSTRRVNVGEGKVFVMRENKMKIVMSYEGEERKIWEKKPATNFARAFVKAYKKANDSK
jgi:phage gp45-like